MTDFASRWLDWEPGKPARVGAERGAKSDKSPSLTPFDTFGTAVVQSSEKKSPKVGAREQPQEPQPEAASPAKIGSPGPQRSIGLDTCLSILDANIRDLPNWYAAGALPWANQHSPELTQQLQAREAVLDALAKTEPTEAKWRAAVTEYMVAWREISERYRAHRERGL